MNDQISDIGRSTPLPSTPTWQHLPIPTLWESLQVNYVAQKNQNKREHFKLRPYIKELVQIPCLLSYEMIKK